MFVFETGGNGVFSAYMTSREYIPDALGKSHNL